MRYCSCGNILHRAKAKHCSIECRNISYRGKHFSPSNEFYKGQIHSSERNHKISIAHKGKFFGARGLKERRFVCKVCKKAVITKKVGRAICDDLLCQRMKYCIKTKPSLQDETERRHKISSKLKGRIPKNLAFRIKSNNSYKQKDMFDIIRRYFEDAEYNFYLKTNRSFRILDVALVKYQIDFEYNGKIHLMKNVANLDELRTYELEKLGWRVIVVDRTNIGTLEVILTDLKSLLL
jgi:very-short-patch-repair endonuclease